MTQQLRILILNYEYPPLGGGAGIATKHLAEHFAKSGHHVQIVTTWFDGYPEYSSEDNLTIIRLKSRRKVSYKSNPIEMTSWARQALNYFKNIDEHPHFDVCFANFTLPGGIVAKQIKEKWDIPYIILSHGHDIPWFAPHQMFPWHLLTYFWIRKIMRTSSKNILLTQDLKKAADKFIGKEFIHKNKVIPNGMLMDNYKSGFDNSNAEMNILFVGRMVDQKDPLTFIRACHEINKLKIPVQFKMIGDGPLKAQVEKLALRFNLPNIQIMGQVSHYEVLKSYEKADILIMPSREEAMSLVLLEAVSRGIYVISTLVSDIDKMVEDDVNGKIVDHNSPIQISHAVADFYYNKYLKNYQYPEDLIQKLFERYSWDKVVEDYIDVFYKISKKEKSISIHK
ncbi:MAG: glycosyltransferase family 4 protein [Chitinophagales bacterium]|nr:glycosyltransferase family 4 protein [Chitinophagales bacterium]